MNMNNCIVNTANTFSYTTSTKSVNACDYAAPSTSIKMTEGQYCNLFSDINKGLDSVEITDYKSKMTIKDINVYGKPDPKVVEVEFENGYDKKTTKIKAVCDKDDVFDLEFGVYIAMAKYLYGKALTTKGIEFKAFELSLYTENEKKVRKAIKEYHKKIKALEDEKKELEEQKKAKLRRKEKNHLRRQKIKERKQKELIKLIDKVVKNS